MRLYIGIVKAAAALLVATVLLVGTSYAMPLPSTPPELDSTPVSHEDEPEGFRDAESIPEPTAKPIEDTPLRALNKTSPQPDPPADATGIDTASVLLIGAAIWYVITLVGITGGRRGGIRRKKRYE